MGPPACMSLIEISNVGGQTLYSVRSGGWRKLPVAIPDNDFWTSQSSRSWRQSDRIHFQQQRSIAVKCRANKRSSLHGR